MDMKKYELYDVTRYFHNVRKKDGSLNPILGEDELALTSILSYLLEDTNFVIKAYSGTGKTVIMDAIFGLLPDEFYHTMEHLSETAVWYEMDKINRARFVAIPEAQKLPEPVMEVVKTWGDGRAAQRKRTDVTIKDTVTQTLNAKYVFMCVAVSFIVTSVLFLCAALPSPQVFTTSITGSGNFWASGMATNLARLILSISYHTAVSDKCSIV
jgi:hypothetical protein